jgi:uncharacterized protein (TIGR03083 family)
MNDTTQAALVDTSRDELRERIADASQRFDRLVRTADPLARVPGHSWTVHQTVAHVLTIVHRYRQVARGLMYRPGASPHAIAALNQTELEAAMAPVPELADEIQEQMPEVQTYFDTVDLDRPAFPFHQYAVVTGFTSQTNLLGELVLHGEDIARAVKAPWKLDERDMLLVARGLAELVPPYVRRETAANADVTVAFDLPGARPYVIRIDRGNGEMRERRHGDRPDATLRMPASTFIQLLYQRIGPLTAARRGLRIVGGRRPWVALKLMAYIEPA